ncbi:hypothetical protein ACFL35_05570 [Candidatus Riflebacteria bacterium]
MRSFFKLLFLSILFIGFQTVLVAGPLDEIDVEDVNVSEKTANDEVQGKNQALTIPKKTEKMIVGPNFQFRMVKSLYQKYKETEKKYYDAFYRVWLNNRRRLLSKKKTDEKRIVINPIEFGGVSQKELFNYWRGNDAKDMRDRQAFRKKIKLRIIDGINDAKAKRKCLSSIKTIRSAVKAYNKKFAALKKFPFANNWIMKGLDLYRLRKYGFLKQIPRCPTGGIYRGGLWDSKSEFCGCSIHSAGQWGFPKKPPIIGKPLISVKPVEMLKERQNTVKSLFKGAFGKTPSRAELLAWAPVLGPVFGPAVVNPKKLLIDIKSISSVAKKYSGVPPSPKEVKFYLDQVQKKRLTMDQVHNLIAGKAKETRKTITSVYKDLLKRAPSPREMLSWHTLVNEKLLNPASLHEGLGIAGSLSEKLLGFPPRPRLLDLVSKPIALGNFNLEKTIKDKIIKSPEFDKVLAKKLDVASRLAFHRKPTQEEVNAIKSAVKAGHISAANALGTLKTVNEAFIKSHLRPPTPTDVIGIVQKINQGAISNAFALKNHVNSLVKAHKSVAKKGIELHKRLFKKGVELHKKAADVHKKVIKTHTKVVKKLLFPWM